MQYNFWFYFKMHGKCIYEELQDSLLSRSVQRRQLFWMDVLFRRLPSLYSLSSYNAPRNIKRQYLIEQKMRILGSFVSEYK